MSSETDLSFSRNEARKFLCQSRDVFVALSGIDACKLLKMNSNTFKTRLARKQAISSSPKDGSRRGVRFTGWQLVYNLIHDRLFTLGLSEYVDVDKLTNWSFANIISEPFHEDACFHINRSGDTFTCTMKTDCDFSLGDDVSVLVPIGRLVTELALRVYIKSRYLDEA